MMDEKEQLASPDGSTSDNFVSFCFNSQNGEIFGRRLSSWLKVLTFLFVFSCGVSFVFAISIWTFYQTIDSYTPKLQQESSFIGVNPGLGYRPMILNENPYSSLIHFIHGGSGNWQGLRDNLIDFLKVYEPGYWANAGASQTKCHWTSESRSKESACEFNKEWLSNPAADIKCIQEEHFGYYHGKPCILIKMNKIYGWRPEPYFNLTEVDSHPDMPADLKSHIRTVWESSCRGKGEELEMKCPQLNMVWLHCQGENAPDIENMGPVTYTPFRGFPAYYFPYYNQLGYLQPIVMIQLTNPTPGVLMNIECTPWAKGIIHDKVKRRGLIHFEFLMD